MNKKWIFSILSGLCYWISLSTHATTQLVSALSGGPAWSQPGLTQSFYLQPGFNNTYVAHDTTQVLTSGEWFVGIQRPFLFKSVIQLGPALATSSAAHLQGIIWELADPQFDNFTYQYRVLHSHVAFKGKWLSEAWSETYLPYVSGSVGAAWNRAYHFSTTPLIFQAVPEPPFQSHTQTAFTYTAGAGIQTQMNLHWQLGVGYEFADWGEGSLSRAFGQTLNSGLALNHLYTHQLQFNLTYLA